MLFDHGRHDSDASEDFREVIELIYDDVHGERVQKHRKTEFVMLEGSHQIYKITKTAFKVTVARDKFFGEFVEEDCHLYLSEVGPAYCLGVEQFDEDEHTLSSGDSD